MTQQLRGGRCRTQPARSRVLPRNWGLWRGLGWPDLRVRLHRAADLQREHMVPPLRRSRVPTRGHDLTSRNYFHRSPFGLTIRLILRWITSLPCQKSVCTEDPQTAPPSQMHTSQTVPRLSGARRYPGEAHRATDAPQHPRPPTDSVRPRNEESRPPHGAPPAMTTPRG